MNERIRELAEQAQPDPIAYRVEHFQGDVGYWDKDEPVWKSELYQKDSDHFTCKPLYTQEDLEKFAELIVRECIKESLNEIVSGDEIAQEKDPLNKEYLKGNNQGIVDAVVRFRNHFGVEEWNT